MPLPGDGPIRPVLVWRPTAADVDAGALQARLREVGAIVDREALPTISPRVDPE